MSDAGAHEHGGHEHLCHVPDASRPAVYAARAVVAFDPPASADLAEAAVDRFLAALSSALAAAGCTLVGHIKGSLASPGHGDLAFHLTALTAQPALTGGHAGLVSAATLTLNVIVFGVDEQALPGLIHQAWSGATGVAATWPS